MSVGLDDSLVDDYVIVTMTIWLQGPTWLNYFSLRTNSCSCIGNVMCYPFGCRQGWLMNEACIVCLNQLMIIIVILFLFVMWGKRDYQWFHCYCVLWHGLWGELLWCAWRGKWLCGSNRNHGCEQDCCAFVTTFSSDLVRMHDYHSPCFKNLQERIRFRCTYKPNPGG